MGACHFEEDLRDDNARNLVACMYTWEHTSIHLTCTTVKQHVHCLIGHLDILVHKLFDHLLYRCCRYMTLKVCISLFQHD